MGINFPIQHEHFKHQREKHGYTQVKLCDEIEREPKTYRKWETGKERPACDVLVDLSDRYGVSTDYLLGLIDENLMNSEINSQVEDAAGSIWLKTGESMYSSARL